MVAGAAGSLALRRGSLTTARALGLTLLLVALVLLLASSAYGAEVYGKIGAFNGSATFGAAGPGSSAVHGASKTLYVVDSSNQRILKFDVSDPAAPVPASFSALGSNAITQADGTALDLGPNANIAVDNSGGPQDGTLYLATNTINNAASRASAFAPTGAWRYDFRHDNLDDNNVVSSGGVLMPAAAIAVGPSGEIFRLGTPATTDSTGGLYAPGAQPGALPTFRMVGSPFVYGTVMGAFFWPDASEVVAPNALFGTSVNLNSSPLTTLITDVQFRYYLSGVAATAVTPTATQGNVIARLNAVLFPQARPARLAVMRFTSTGALNPGIVEEEFALGSAGSGIGLAYEAARDLVFSADTASKSIAVYGRVTVPDVEMLDPGYTDATTATLQARVDLRGTTVTACRFEWGATAAYGSTVPCTSPSGSAPVTVSAPVTPVTVGSVYHARLVLTVNGEEVTGPDLEWQQPDLPDATTLGAGTITRAGTALLGGTVNPKGTRNTRYFVEYATNPSLTNPSVAPEGRDGNAGSGTAAVRRSTVVEGLQPATTYYFRLVAETGAGRSEGAIRGFRTFSEPSSAQPTSCPNSPFRTGDSAMLPDCRAWEKISPDDKGGGITVSGQAFARADGDRVMFGGKFALDDMKSYGTTATFMADRGDSGWATQTLQETSSMPDNGITADWNYAGFTRDLKWLVGGAYNVDLPGIGHPYNDPVYIRDVDGKQTSVIAVGDRKTVLAEGSSNKDPRGGLKVAADRRAVIFKGKNLPVASGARHPGNAMYWWTPESGVTVASQGPNGAPVNIANTFQSAIHGISPDGNRALWEAGPGGTPGLFVSRRNGTTLEATKASGVPQPSGPAAVQGWTPDLRYVYFTSAQPFTSDALAGTNLYRFDTKEEQLENLLPNIAGGAGVQAIANLSPDGQHVYFYATAQLATGADASGLKLYHWHNGTVTLVTNAAYYATVSGYGFVDTASSARLSRVSRDGRYFLFAHQGSLAGTAMDSVVDPNGKRMLFRYDAQEQRIDCVSCSPTRHATDADAYLMQPVTGSMKHLNAGMQMAGERYFMSDRGVVLFTTAEPLTAGDVNGTYDSYLWDGDLRRITSGKSALPEWAETATEDFRDIFVHSSRQLVASDDDDSADLYTARVGGGLASQQVRPDRGGGDRCGGDRCQGPGTAPLPSPLLQSATVFGAGNLPALPTPVRASVRVTRPKAVRARTVKLKARVSGAGRLRVTGKGLRQTAKTTKKAQTVTVTVRLSAWGTKQLRKRRSLTVNARVTFAPKSGAAASGRVKLTFRQPAATSTTTKKGGR